MISKMNMLADEIDTIDEERKKLQEERIELQELYCNLYYGVKS